MAAGAMSAAAASAAVTMVVRRCMDPLRSATASPRTSVIPPAACWISDRRVGSEAWQTWSSSRATATTHGATWSSPTVGRARASSSSRSGGGWTPAPRRWPTASARPASSRSRPTCTTASWPPTTRWTRPAELMQSLPIDRAARDMSGAVDFLAGHPATTGDGIGVVGFCMGGMLTFVLAAERPDRVKAAVPFYGFPPIENGPADLSKIEASIQGHMAEHDDFFPPDAGRCPRGAAAEPGQGRHHHRPRGHRPRLHGPAQRARHPGPRRSPRSGRRSPPSSTTSSASTFRWTALAPMEQG